MTNPDRIAPVPLDQIDDAALTRDRAAIDASALAELRQSIAAHGLRLPVELFALETPRPPLLYGLISGLRRLIAFRELLELTGQKTYAAIPALIRQRGSTADALAAMVEENEIRAVISPWERGRIAVVACDQGLFGTIDEAVERLYPAADRNKRSRLRALARLVERLDGHLTDPERLSQRQCLRLAAAIDKGYGEVIHTALAESSLRDPDTQWRLIEPILAEADRAGIDYPMPRPGRPRMVLRPRPALTVRRERTRDGWCLHFTGREAKSGMIAEVLEDIERMYSPD